MVVLDGTLIVLSGVQRQLKIFVQSPGMLADPYKPPPPPLPFLKRWFSLEGWKRIREGIMDSVSGLRAPLALPSLHSPRQPYRPNRSVLMPAARGGAWKLVRPRGASWCIPPVRGLF